MTEEAETVKKSEKLQSKTKDRSTKRDRVKPLTKVVIRRLPPTMNEEDFLKQIEPLPDHEYYYYVPADWSLGYDATCRAYINFSNPDDIFLFKDRFDGYVFVDNKGAEYPAVVEFAPFQGLPRNKSRKRDPKCNTIETDPHYLSFLENLKNEENESGKTEVKLEFSLQSKEDKRITSTPLLQYLANKKQERRDERKKKLEEKRRQREEERQRKRNQVAKNVPPPIKEEDTKGNKESTSTKEKDQDRQEDLKKEARLKRRAARDLKRKLEREKRNNQDKKSDDGNQEKTVEKSDSQDKFVEREDEKKKEVKKYSQSRRSRNEFKKSDVNNETSTDNKEPANTTASGEKDSKEMKEKTTDAGEISDSVKEFIKSVANIKEFVPRSRTILTNTDLESSIKTSSTPKEIDMGEVREKLEKIAMAEKEDKSVDKIEDKTKADVTKQKSTNEDNSPENGARDSSCSGTDKNERGKDRDNRGVRRIRNKDRPSIEIYQPGKLRLKKDDSKDGRSSAELKDYKSNPTSDCESIKKEKDEKEGVRRKVSRYSERRSSRAKEKSIIDEKEGPTSKNPSTSNETPVQVKEENLSDENK